MALPSTMAEMWTTVGSTLASFMFLFAILRQYCPYEIRRLLEKLSLRITSFFYPYVRISVHEFSGDRLKRSEAFLNIEAYLGANTSKSATRLRAELGKDSTKLVLSMDEFERVTDEFAGAKLWWLLGKSPSPARTPASMSYFSDQEKRFYKLTFHKKHREIVTESYLGHVIKQGKEIRVRNRQRKLYTNSPGYKWPSYKQTMWSHILFEHPATFETLAMEEDKKREIIEDLLTFSQSREFYERIGRAWKRGYLLFGPPGTGKSTMIAAMANLLGYDVYDLELTAVKDNTELRRLLIETTSKSIIVIEDIDCSLDLTGQRKGVRKGEKVSGEEFEEESRKEGKEEGVNGNNNNNNNNNGNSKVTLSGLLNFIDGLWSACGGERLIVFTTNYVEKLDPALIRRGRMDKHIELSYCTFQGFKVLAKNYLRLECHEMFAKIEGLIREVRITPADVAESLMPKSPVDDPEKCLLNLIKALEEAKEDEAAEEEAKRIAHEEYSNVMPPMAKEDWVENEEKEGKEY